MVGGDHLGYIPGRSLPAQGHGQGIGQDRKEQGHGQGGPLDPILQVQPAGGTGQTDGQRRQIGEGVSGVFGGHAFKEEPSEENPQGQEPLPVIQALPEGPAFDPFLQGLPVFLPQPGQAQAPGEAANEENQEIIPPSVVPGMLGNGGPEHIVDPDEPIQEGAAVEDCHRDVPKGSDGQGQDEAPEQLHMGQGPEIPVAGQIGQDDQPRQH